MVCSVSVVQWGRKMVKEVLPLAYKYLETSKTWWAEYQQDLLFFETQVKLPCLESHLQSGATICN